MKGKEPLPPNYFDSQVEQATMWSKPLDNSVAADIKRIKSERLKVLFCWIQSRSVFPKQTYEKIPPAVYEVNFKNDTLIFDFSSDVRVYLKTGFRFPPDGATVTINVDEDQFFKAVDKQLFAPIINLMIGSEITGGISGYLLTWALLNQFVKTKIFQTYDQEVALNSYKKYLEKVEL